MLQIEAAQIIGTIGIIVWFLSFQIKSNKRLFIVQILANMIFCVQFILLGAYAGCIGLFVCCIRNVLIIKRNDWKWANSKVWVAGLITINVALTIISWKSIWDIFALIACVSAVIIYWSNNARNIRAGNLFITCPAWLAYDIYYRAWPSVISEASAIISIIVSIYRFGWRELGENSAKFSGEENKKANQ